MNNGSPVIDIENLNKSFKGQQVVFDFNLILKKGGICGFLGPNGSGKTTCLRMLCGLLKPDSGTGHCLGFDILKNSQDIKERIGYMPQKFGLYNNLTVYENLDFLARLYDIKQRKNRINDILSQFDFMDYQNHLAGTLSGGWKQRLGLASCLLHNPELLLLDEPTGGVDSKARRDFWDKLFLLSEQGITTLVSTHYMDEAERCTHLVYLSAGHLLVEGSISEVIRKAGLITWMVKGKKLMPLAEQLKGAPGVEQVAFFGEKLHINGRDEKLLLASIAPFKDYSWERISPSLEDAFLSFIKES